MHVSHLHSCMEALAGSPPPRVHGAAGAAFELDGASYEDLLRLDDTIVKKGVAVAILDRLPDYAFKSRATAAASSSVAAAADSSLPQCNICCCDFEDAERVTRLPCLCLYHTPCIRKWLATSKKCPVRTRPINIYMTCARACRMCDASPPFAYTFHTHASSECDQNTNLRRVDHVVAILNFVYMYTYEFVHVHMWARGDLTSTSRFI